MNAENNEAQELSNKFFAEFDKEIIGLLNEITEDLREDIHDFKNSPFQNNKNYFVQKGRISEKHNSLERFELLKFMLKHYRQPRANELWMLKY